MDFNVRFDEFARHQRRPQAEQFLGALDAVEAAEVRRPGQSQPGKQAPEPVGHARWSLTLLADKAVELGYCEHLSPSYAGVLLKKTNSART